MGVKMQAIGCYKPKVYVSNEIWQEKFAPKIKVGGHQFARIATEGIQERYYAAPQETVVSMAKEAIQDCLSKAQIDANSIDLFIHTSVVSDYIGGDATRILQQIGAKNAFAYEVTDVFCAGSMVPILQACLFLESGLYKNVLVSCVGNPASRGGNMRDLLAAGLGDLATAILLKKCDGDAGFMAFSYQTFPQYTDAWKFIPLKEGVMAWQEAHKNKYWANFFHHAPIATIPDLQEAISKYPLDMVQRTLQKANLKIEDIQWLITHQAGGLLKMWRDLFGIKESSHLHTFSEVGNTSMCNIPYTLMKATEKKVFSQGDKILLVGLGSGMHIVVAIYKWE
ncbi:MAG: hypothetical protein HUU50_15635 [Candidatus Brocadiae bacterium]|nr:hypothetical protein [Candidatus Brocadiia bacterium]